MKSVLYIIQSGINNSRKSTVSIIIERSYYIAGEVIAPDISLRSLSNRCRRAEKPPPPGISKTWKCWSSGPRPGRNKEALITIWPQWHFDLSWLTKTAWKPVRQIIEVLESIWTNMPALNTLLKSSIIASRRWWLRIDLLNRLTKTLPAPRRISSGS